MPQPEMCRARVVRVFVQVMPEKQPVFAFLPLRSYGFRFVIQGSATVSWFHRKVYMYSATHRSVISICTVACFLCGCAC